MLNFSIDEEHSIITMNIINLDKNNKLECHDTITKNISFVKPFDKLSMHHGFHGDLQNKHQLFPFLARNVVTM